MIIDSSAVLALLRREAEADRFEEVLFAAAERRMSAVNAMECRVVLFHRFGAEALGDFERLVDLAGVVIEPFDADQAIVAFEGYRRFGKGTQHAAQLNLGDCAAYALAVSRGEPLLFKGNDFPHTDVESAA